MLVDLGRQHVAVRPVVGFPEIALPEPHEIEMPLRQARLVVGQELRVAEGAQHLHHLAGAALEVKRRAMVPVMRAERDRYPVARPVARRHHRACPTPRLASISATLASISTSESTP